MQALRQVLASVAWLVFAAHAQASEPSKFDWAAHGFGPGPAGNEGDNGWIGIFADPLGTQPCATIPTGQIATLYLFAFPAGATQDGFTGAEFRIEVTSPQGYQFLYVAPSDCVTLGNPFDLTPGDPTDGSGLNIAFHNCATASRVSMGTILVLNQSGGPTELLVKRRNGPSNPNSNCPLFSDCTFAYELQCMTPCAVDATGGSIAGRASINDPECTGVRDCPATCTPQRCVSLTTTVPARVCVGQPITVTATAENCSQVPEDIDLFLSYELLGSFAAVGPGQSVTASRTYPLPGCVNGRWSEQVGAVVRTADCDQPAGREKLLEFLCTTCAPNQAPDCSAVQASLSEIWPPDGRMQPVTISGFSDPDGDPLTATVTVISTDEPSGTYGSSSCPDAIIEGPLATRLRAERAADGNGRVYTLQTVVLDPSGLWCDKLVEVFVPRKPGEASILDGFQYDATKCARQTGNRTPRVLSVKAADRAGTEIRFSAAAETDATVEVFDMRGRRLATVARSRFGPGEHVLRWDGRDGDGSAVATGIYLFRLTAGGNVETTKAIVMQ